MEDTRESDTLISVKNPPINPDYEDNLEHAANDVYEVFVDEEDDSDPEEDVVWLREQRNLNKAIHWLKRPSVFMVGVPIFLFALAISSGDSTRRMITFKLACNFLANNSNEGTCDPTATQLLVSNLYLGYSILAGICMMFALGKIGPLSDQYGRKLFLVLNLVVFFFARCFKFYVMHHYEYLQFGLMVITEIACNVCGGTLALVTLCNCYIADVVNPHERIYSFGLSVAFLFIGLSIGPMIGNALLSLPDDSGSIIASATEFTNISKREFLPLKFELLVLFLVSLFTCLVVPESRSERARNKSRSEISSLNSSVVDPEEASPIDKPNSIWMQIGNTLNFLKPLRLLTLPSDVCNFYNERELKRYRVVVIILVIIDCMLTGLSISLAEIFILFGIYKYNWTSIDIGHFFAVACFSRAIILIIISPVITHKILNKVFKFKVLKKQFDMVDFSVCIIGLTLDGIGLLMFSVAPSTTCFLLATSVASFGTLASPSLNSAIIKFYPESKTGEIFGALALLKNLFTLAGPLLFIPIYKTSLSEWNAPGVVFLIGGLILFACSISLVIAKKLLRLNRNTNDLRRILSTISTFRPLEDEIESLQTD